MKNVAGSSGAVIAVLVSLVAGPWAAEASASGCPNAAVRGDVARQLPDCRAYEQVSPPDKNGNDVGLRQGGDKMIQTYVAAADGGGVVYETQGVFPGANSALLTNATLSRRGATGWQTQVLAPAQLPVPFPSFASFMFFTPNLDKAVVRTPVNAHLADNDTADANNLYLRDNDHGTYTTLSVHPPVTRVPDQIVYTFAGASADMRHVLFTSDDALTPDAPVPPPPPANGLTNLYEWVGGQLRLVTILPDGTPSSTGGLPGGGTGAPTPTAISEDGSRVIFGTPDGNPQDGGQIYLRENGSLTVLVSGSRRATSDPGGHQPPRFWGASADGSDIYFTSTEALTDDATLGVTSLYRYNVELGTLSNLTVEADPSAPPGGGVVGVLGLSKNGSDVYFQSTRQYLPGKGSFGEWNLYRWHEGAISLVLTDDATNILSVFEAAHKTARLTPDGQHLLYMSSRSLTGYDNTDAVTGQPDNEVFLYDASSNKLTCVSCNPRGRRPVGPSTLPEPPVRPQGNLQRGVTDDGRRVFFESGDDLVPADVNGKIDVYEYEDGAVHLISTGSSEGDSYFASASANGDDVFFMTSEQLVPADVDDNLDMYDARVDGGFPQPARAQPCSGDACQGPPALAPADPSPASRVVAGDGNASARTPSTPSFRVTVPSKSAQRQAARTGYVTLAVRVSEGGTVKARVSRTVRGRATTVGTANVNAPRAGTVRVRVHLAMSVRSALAHKAKVRLSVRVSFSHVRSAKTMTLELRR
ncbi:MAG TPA: hypothetical protein VFG42_00395 [Baekduia sp.]|uniref:TolB family protein n=1 Tax=Baekduia sp. TaxID=2600305 RepID=UPI002D778F01|nr:hypothetical protein [Baekduia sp.]HET6505218.1 hypothetical protein [Baekduia sp.]